MKRMRRLGRRLGRGRVARNLAPVTITRRGAPRHRGQVALAALRGVVGDLQGVEALVVDAGDRLDGRRVYPQVPTARLHLERPAQRHQLAEEAGPWRPGSSRERM